MSLELGDGRGRRRWWIGREAPWPLRWRQARQGFGVIGPGVDAATRRTLAGFGVAGLVLGVGAAVLLHGLPASMVGGASVFAWAAPGLFPSRTPVTVTLDWWPSLGSLAGFGLLAGLVVALVLRRLGWVLARVGDDGAAGSTGSAGTRDDHG